ncbi:hypothetical protein DID76_02365 [Candidatus Marinamargulisbacteria bacterium SCGC AG-414-C22]|nr:hypothetical protein DID76_02365 [Candidatus Marinamargulisbacteria bacterium SCGC AG-414-C22]
MKRFLCRLLIFSFIFSLWGEVIVRVFKLTPEIPSLFIDDSKIQRYIPYQSGYYTKSKEKWKVNKYGWTGIVDIVSHQSVISIIGDSFIENFMNPKECNQASFIKKEIENYGFFEAGRSGVNFIEALEISDYLAEFLNIETQLLYLNSNDFFDSVFEKNNRKYQAMKIDLETSIVLNSSLKFPLLKKVLYNFKFFYYLYQRFYSSIDLNTKKKAIKTSQINQDYSKINKLLKYASKNYNLKNLHLVFHPNTDPEIIKLSNKHGFKSIQLDSNNTKAWTFEHDNHWSCYGHKEASIQVTNYLNELLQNKTKSSQ